MGKGELPREMRPKPLALEAIRQPDKAGGADLPGKPGTTTKSNLDSLPRVGKPAEPETPKFPGLEDLPELARLVEVRGLVPYLELLRSMLRDPYAGGEDETLQTIGQLFASPDKAAVVDFISVLRRDLTALNLEKIPLTHSLADQLNLTKAEREEQKKSQGDENKQAAKRAVINGLSKLWSGTEQRWQLGTILDAFPVLFSSRDPSSALLRWLVSHFSQEVDSEGATTQALLIDEKQLPPKLLLAWNKLSKLPGWEDKRFFKLWCVWAINLLFITQDMLKEKTGFVDVVRQRRRANSPLPKSVTDIRPDDLTQIAASAEEVGEVAPAPFDEIVADIFRNRSKWFKLKRLFDNPDIVAEEGGYSWNVFNPGNAKILTDDCADKGVPMTKWLEDIIPKNDKEIRQLIAFMKAILGCDNPESRQATAVIQERREASLSSPKKFFEHLLWEIKLLIMWTAILQMREYERAKELEQRKQAK